MVAKTNLKSVSPEGSGDFAQKKAALGLMKDVVLLTVQWAADLALNKTCSKTRQPAHSCKDCVTGSCGTAFTGFADLSNIVPPHIPQIPDMLGQVSGTLLRIWSE